MTIIKSSMFVVAVLILAGCVSQPYTVPEGVETTKVQFLKPEKANRFVRYDYSVSIDDQNPADIKATEVEGSSFVHENQFPLNTDLRFIVEFSVGNMSCDVATSVNLGEVRDYRVYSRFKDSRCGVGVFYQDGEEWVLVE